MRILITGSRNWTDRVLISRIILDEINKVCPMILDSEGKATRRDTSSVVIVHGGALGADLLTEAWARGCHPPIRTEPHALTPRDWDRNPRVAGYLRNSEMVRLGADVCIAFIKPCSNPRCARMEAHGSHGATHCSDLADSEGIRTRRIE